jgi:AcrR family transcriptional regulator
MSEGLTQSEIKYNRLMEKAKELFVSLGYKAVSMDDIAEAAGISKMTIYKHFSSKEELFIEVVMSLMEGYYVYIENEIKKVSGTIEKINVLMNFNLEASQDFSFAFYKDIMSIPYITERITNEKYKMSKKVFENIITEGVEKKEIREVNVSFITDMLLMIVEAMGEKYIKQVKCQKDIDTIVESFYDFLKYGLLGNEVK